MRFWVSLFVHLFDLDLFLDSVIISCQDGILALVVKDLLDGEEDAAAKFW